MRQMFQNLLTHLSSLANERPTVFCHSIRNTFQHSRLRKKGTSILIIDKIEFDNQPQHEVIICLVGIGRDQYNPRSAQRTETHIIRNERGLQSQRMGYHGKNAVCLRYLRIPKHLLDHRTMHRSIVFE